jgi:hypothetical protein
MPAAAGRKTRQAGAWACTAEIAAAAICHMLDTVDMALEASPHVGKEAEPGDKMYCKGSCSHCIAVQPADTAVGCRGVSYSYRVVCPALPADDVHSSCQRGLILHRPITRGGGRWRRGDGN